ncbi:2922_t:CDS:2, partial [Entrophospora sp. SA101]
MPEIEKVFIEERKVVKDKDGNDEKVFFMEEIDALAQQNTSRVIKILANPNDYSLEDILKLGKKELKGELRRKFNIDEEGKSNQKKEKEEVPPLEKDSDSP